ncbi:hypothetical protein N0V82_002595 [Gnomoniopsis sp. IMI 355080]|nr:hypothetical protein N0V82_002595 [Gnomoniopsis sp. IMI 355080]
MQTFTSFLLLALSATALAFPTQPGRRTTCDGTSTSPSAAPVAAAGSNSTTTSGAINPALVPDFGVVAGTNEGAQQAGSCDGFAAATNAKVLIPCTCPPSRDSFLAALNKNVAAGQVQGTPVKFNNNAADQSTATNQQRGTAMLVTLQNLFGPGKGCPAASAPNFAVLQKSGTVSSKLFVGPGATA